MGLDDSEYKEISGEALKQMIDRIASSAFSGVPVGRGFVVYGSSTALITEKDKLQWELGSKMLLYEVMIKKILKKHCT